MTLLPATIVALTADPNTLRITSWVSFLVIGFIIGLLARWLTPGNRKMGCLSTIFLGVVGSFVAGVATRYFFNDGPGFIASVIGAVVVLVVWTAVFGKKRG